MPTETQSPIKKVTGLALESFAYLRSLLFLQEGLPLQWVDSVINLQKPVGLEGDGLARKVLPHYFRIIREDIAHIVNGDYPASVLWPEGPRRHARRYADILRDAIRLSVRRRRGRHHDFSVGAKIEAQGLPDYYVRNFHHQTDGYLSDLSAQIYDHQVDILFRGTTGAMRRMILPPLKTYLEQNPKAQVLELGCGTGSATKDFLKTFPDQALTAIDLSRPYLKYAADALRTYSQTQFLIANAEELPFPNEAYVAVFSVYLFHELPLASRKRVIAEAFRVLERGGIFLIVDSVQRGDQADFDVALKIFPQVFHEPFFKNYTETPLQTLLEEQGFRLAEGKTGGSSKLWWAVKP